MPLFKFLSGGALAWIITLCVPFMNTFKDKKTKDVYKRQVIGCIIFLDEVPDVDFFFPYAGHKAGPFVSHA